MNATSITWDFGGGRVRPPFTIHTKQIKNGTLVTIRCDYLSRNNDQRLVNAYNLAWTNVPDGVDTAVFAHNLLALAELRYEMEVVNAD